MALSSLGAGRITALTDGTIEAKYCNIFYDDVVDRTISAGSWASAVYRAELNATVNTPDFEFDYEFQLPTNPFCLKVLDVSEIAPGAEDFRIEGNKLVANISTMHIRYLGRITDPNSYGVFLTGAITAELAHQLAYPLTGQASVRKMMKEEAMQALIFGLSNDGQQGSADVWTSSDLTDVR